MRQRNQTGADGKTSRIQKARIGLFLGILVSLGGFDATAAAQGLNITIDGSSLTTFAIGAVIRIGLSAAGGTEPYHFSLTPGATEIPGLRVVDEPPLPGAFPFQADYAGLAITGGIYNTSIRVTDSLGQTSDQVVTVRIASSNIVSQFNLPNATVGVPYSFTLTMFPAAPSVRTNNGVPNQVNAWSASDLPPGLQVDFSGNISGTPTAAGNYSPAFSRLLRTWIDFNRDFVPDCDLASIFGNGECGASPTMNALRMSESLTVDPFAITTNGALPQGIVGTHYPNLALAAPGCGSHKRVSLVSFWSWLFGRHRGCTWTALGDLPSGLSLSSGGVISGTPGSTFNGIFSIQAANSSSGAVQKVFAQAIASNAVLPLTITNGSPVGPTPLGAGVAVPLFASGGTPPYSWSIVLGGTPPPGVTLQGPAQSLGCMILEQDTRLCSNVIPPLGPGDTLGALTGPGLTYLAGRVMAPGMYDFTLAVTDATGNTVTAPLTWLVTSTIL